MKISDRIYEIIKSSNIEKSLYDKIINIIKDDGFISIKQALPEEDDTYICVVREFNKQVTTFVYVSDVEWEDGKWILPNGKKNDDGIVVEAWQSRPEACIPEENYNERIPTPIYPYKD